VSRYNDSTATTEDLQAVFEEASGQNLDAFFDIWLRDPVKPTTW
jgi:aminopeptidase N